MNRTRKQWPLEVSETITSFERWKSNLVYNIRQDASFAPFINSSWNKFSKKETNKYRGLLDDTDATEPDKNKQKNRAAKLADLELMLEMVANWAPIISRQSIIKHSTSLESIWQAIRAHYGIQTISSTSLRSNSSMAKDTRIYISALWHSLKTTSL